MRAARIEHVVHVVSTGKASPFLKVVGCIVAIAVMGWIGGETQAFLP